MRMPTSILTLATALLLVSTLRSQAGAVSKDQPDESVKKVQELRKQRIAVLKDLTETLETLYKAARSFDEVLAARQMLLDAELEAAKTEAERVELYKNHLVVLRAYEASADQLVQMGRGTAASALKAKAKRLEAEIHLEQLKQKLANAGK